MSGHVICLEKLVRAGADVNAKGILAETVENNDFVCFDLLLQAGANVNLKDEGGETPLMNLFRKNGGCESLLSAAKKGHHQCIRHLAHNQEDQASYCEDIYRIAKLLIEKGTDVNAIDSDGTTTLMKAVPSCEYVQLLLQAGADVNATDKVGHTALEKEVLYAKCVELLLMKGVDVGSQRK